MTKEELKDELDDLSEKIRDLADCSITDIILDIESISEDIEELVSTIDNANTSDAGVVTDAPLADGENLCSKLIAIGVRVDDLPYSLLYNTEREIATIADDVVGIANDITAN